MTLLAPLSGVLSPLGQARRAAAAAGVMSDFCLAFDGVNDFVALTSASFVGLSAGSISLWYKPIATTANNAALYYESTGTSGYTRFAIYHLSTGAISGSMRDTETGAAFAATWTAGATNNLGRWIHLVLTFDAATDSLILYANGLPVASESSVKGSFTGTASADPFVIGAYKAGVNVYPVNGFIDDVRTYNVALTAAQVQTMHRNQAPAPTTGLVGHWTFDEGTGTSAADSSGNGNTGTLTDGPTWQPQTPPRLIALRNTEDWSVSFDGTNDYITVGDPAALDFNQQSFSVSAWIKPATLAGVTAFNVCSKWGQNNRQFTLSVRPSGASNPNTVEFETGSGTSDGGCRSTLTISAGRWVHLVGVYTDSASPTCDLYFDGLLVASNSTVRIAGSSQNLRIGARDDLAPNYFNGIIKDVRVFSSAISAASVRTLAQGKEPGDTMVARWRLNEGTGTNALDSVGGYNGTLTNGPTWSGDVPPHFRQIVESSQALNLDGTNDSVLCSPAGYSSFSVGTIAGWVYADVVDGDSMVISLNENVGAQNSFHIEQNTAGGQMRVLVRPNAGNMLDMWTQTNVLTAGQWHHFAYVATTTGPKFYWNGALQSMGYNAGGASTRAFLSDITNPQTLYFGKYFGNRYWAGRFDELLISDRPFSAGEVADLAAGYSVSASVVNRWKLDNNANDSAGTNHGTEQGGVGYLTSVPGTL